jgi:hypothetical protein
VEPIIKGDGYSEAGESQAEQAARGEGLGPVGGFAHAAIVPERRLEDVPMPLVVENGAKSRVRLRER